METDTGKVKNMNRIWYLIDAKGKVLGRLASEIAILLRVKIELILINQLI